MPADLGCIRLALVGFKLALATQSQYKNTYGDIRLMTMFINYLTKNGQWPTG